MIHITYKPSTKSVLASGHILFEIFTTFIFSMLLDIKPVWDASWKKSLILTEQSIKYYTDDFGVCWLFPNENKFYTWSALSESLKDRTDRKDWERLKADYLAEATSSEVRFLKVWSNRIEDATLRSEVHAYVDDLYRQLLESVDHLEQVNMLCQLGHQCLHSGDLPQAKENFDKTSHPNEKPIKPIKNTENQ